MKWLQAYALLQISVKASVAAVLSELSGIFTLKQEHGAALKAFEEDVFPLHPTGLRQELKGYFPD